MVPVRADLEDEEQSSLVPETLCSPFGAYPNLLHITNVDREDFHPVMIYPNRTIPINDNTNSQGLASPKEVSNAKRHDQWLTRLWSKHILPNAVAIATLGKRLPGGNKSNSNTSQEWNIGRYDENRVGMYTSELFQDTSNSIDGYGGQRTVHLGIDLGAPVGTKVYAFCEGLVHSVGYNADFGDYGHVLVIEHHLALLLPRPARDDGNDNDDDNATSPRTVFALYGHMHKGTVRGKRPGTRIQKGQVIGRVGDCHDNGGWREPHVHFQLSIHPPENHDMPGASSMADRSSALMDYPDPRYVLGAIH